jgi:hypothetical protein
MGLTEEKTTYLNQPLHVIKRIGYVCSFPGQRGGCQPVLEPLGSDPPLIRLPG